MVWGLAGNLETRQAHQKFELITVLPGDCHTEHVLIKGHAVPRLLEANGKN